MAENPKRENRQEQRTDIGIEVLCSAGREEGTGTLANLSPSGALLEATTLRLTVGDSVTILFPSTSNEDSQVLPTEVIRLTASGFGVKFKVYVPAINRLILEYGVED